MAGNIHVSIMAEPIATVGGFTITNSMLTSTLVSICIIIFAIYANRQIKHTRRPKGLQNVLEFIVEALFNLTNEITVNKAKTQAIFPLTATFFLFIMLNNWAGLLPGVGTIGISQPVHIAQPTIPVSTAYASDDVEPVLINEESELSDAERSAEAEEHQLSKELSQEESHTEFIPLFRAGTADLNTTLALALISVIATQAIGIKYLGIPYFGKFFNFKSPVFFFVGILELISEIAKIISFAFRLFGNIFAGEVLLVVIAFLIPILVPVPFIGLEIFVGAIQALVFMMLSIVFMSMATHGHDEH